MTLNEIYSTPDAEQRRALMSVLAQRAKLHAEKTGISFESALMALTERDKPSTPTGDQAHVYQASDPCGCSRVRLLGGHSRCDGA